MIPHTSAGVTFATITLKQQERIVQLENQVASLKIELEEAMKQLHIVGDLQDSLREFLGILDRDK